MENINKLVSIIVPIYNVKPTLLERCIESILNQTYKNYEVLLVDDATNEENKKQIDLFCAHNKAIKHITHEINRGLFQARLTGVTHSKGDYILFVDADDYITIDWLRLLVKHAEEENADITMGNTICENEDGLKYVINAAINFLKNRDSIEQNVIEILMEDEGKYFPLHVVWNKLYSKRLWERALPFLEASSRHLIMTEDILFSMVLFFYAKKLSFTNHDGYFYYRNSDSSTFNVDGISKVEKNVDDLIFVFSTLKKFMDIHGLTKKYSSNYAEWKNRYFRWWSANIKLNTEDNNDLKQVDIRKRFLDFFEKDDFENPLPEDDLFAIYTTTWESGLEELKRQIVAFDNDVISFDIFDTLIVRPLLEPDDLFELLEYRTPINGKYIFKELRIEAEKECRRRNAIDNPQRQDVTIEEIYATMSERYQLAPAICEKMMDMEISSEIQLCKQRIVGKELYDLAYYINKPIILVSDMYLTLEHINQILERNDYTVHSKIYLSSELGALKSTGKLFTIVVQDPDNTNKQILHIGDNWNSDFLTPKQYGIKTFFLPKTKDILFNTLGDKYTGNSIGYAVNNFNSIIDLKTHLKKLPVKCMYAVIANCMFDNPFISFNDNSDYNGDPFFIGNLAVGMHYWGITLWLMRNLKEHGHNMIHFTSRDGFYLYQIYNLIRDKWYPDAPASDYIYISRKALIPLEIENDLDILTMYKQFAWQGQSPNSILSVYESVLDDISDEELHKKGFVRTQKFSSLEECISFLNFIKEKAFNKEKAYRSQQKCIEYLSLKIKPGDAIFDLGYSGKLQTLIVKALGFSVDTYYVHSNGFEATNRANDNKYNMYCFYDFIPTMSGAISEFILSDYHPSCISYIKSGAQVEPVFETKSLDLINKYIIEEIFRGSKFFAETILDNLRDYKNIFENMNCIDTGVQYERFLMSEKDFDLELFRCCRVEDEYYGGVSYGRLLDVWKWQLNDRQIFRQKEIVYLSSDPKQDNENKEDIEENIDIYKDGVYVKLFYKINKLFPIGSKRRDLLRKVLGLIFR